MALSLFSYVSVGIRAVKGSLSFSLMGNTMKRKSVNEKNV
jgi:hypothetical protein